MMIMMMIMTMIMIMIMITIAIMIMTHQIYRWTKALDKFKNYKMFLKKVENTASGPTRK